MDYEKIQTIVRQILERLNISVDDMHVTETQVHPIIIVETKDSNAIIGYKGETLRALNKIVKQIVERQLGELHSRFLLDVNGYQQKRIEEVKNNAKMLAERARMFQHEVELSPMNAYERMVVHATFTDTPDIATESRGSGKFRHVVIKYVVSKEIKTSPNSLREDPDLLI